VADIGRIVSSDNLRIRWSYVIVLRNTSDRVIQLDRVERAMASDFSEVVGGTPSSTPFRQTLGARSELRFATADNWGWLAEANRAFGGAATLRAVTAYRRFSGTDDRGTPVDVRVRVRLDPSIGVLSKPPTRPESLPAPIRLESHAHLSRVVGLWRGSYRMEASTLDVPIDVTIQANGALEVAENVPVTNRFGRTVEVKAGGLDYSGGRDRGSFSLYEVAGKRMLVGRVSQTDGPAYAVYLEALPTAKGPYAETGWPAAASLLPGPLPRS
jgi:hypothetical protein